MKRGKFRLDNDYKYYSSMDTSLAIYFGAGLVIGTVWLIMLSYFPGGSKTDKPKRSAASKVVSPNNNGSTKESERKRAAAQNDKANAAPSGEHDASNTQKVNTKSAPPNASILPPWTGDAIPPEKLERLRKQFRLTHEQMQQALEESKRESQNINAPSDWKLRANNSPSWTPHQKMNALVYCALFSGLIYTWNRDYDGFVTKWFIRWFPREAAVLGLKT